MIDTAPHKQQPKYLFYSFLIIRIKYCVDLYIILYNQTSYLGPLLLPYYSLMQAVPLSARKAGGGSSEGIASFLQLPHFSEAVVKKIARKVMQYKVSTLNLNAATRVFHTSRLILSLSKI